VQKVCCNGLTKTQKGMEMSHQNKEILAMIATLLLSALIGALVIP